MRFLFIAFALIVTSAAQASFMATHCSNSMRSVHWLSGHNSNTITLTYIDRGPQQVTLPLSQVNLDLGEEVVLREESIHRCGYASHTRVYAAPVEITFHATTNVPAKLLAETENGVIKTEVICNFHVNNRAPCPPTEE